MVFWIAEALTVCVASQRLSFWLRSPGLWEIAEFEVYGDGDVPEATYRSAVLDLGGASTLGPLCWIGFRDRDARVKISTRSGLDADEGREERNGLISVVY